MTDNKIQNPGKELSERDLEAVTGGSAVKQKPSLGVGPNGGSAFCPCMAGPGRHAPGCPYGSGAEDKPM